MKRILIGENIGFGVAKRFRDGPDMDGISPKKCLGILRILVQVGCRLDIKISIQKIQDMTLVAILFNDFRGNKTKFIRLWNLTIELA